MRNILLYTSEEKLQIMIIRDWAGSALDLLEMDAEEAIKVINGLDVPAPYMRATLLPLFEK